MTRYVVDPDRSELTAEAHSNVHPIEIRTHGFEGTIEAEPKPPGLDLSKPPSARLEIDADLMKSGIELYDNEIARMIETRKYPRIRGELLRAEDAGGGRYSLRCKLNFHGVHQELDTQVSVRFPDANTIEIEGEQDIDMRDYNLKPPKILMLEVKPDVRLRAKIVAVRES